MRPDPATKRELLGIAALIVGLFLGLTLLPWRLTGLLGARLGAALWGTFGLGALAVPLLGIGFALAAFGRLGRLSSARVAVLVGGLGVLVPFVIGVVTGVKPSDYDATFGHWDLRARAVGLMAGLVAHGVLRVVGVTGGILIAMLGLSALTLATIGWHPLVALRAGRKPRPAKRGRSSSPKASDKSNNPGPPLAEGVLSDPAGPTVGPANGKGVLNRLARPTRARRRRHGVVDALLPPLDLLSYPPRGDADAGAEQLDKLGRTLIDTLGTFKVEGAITGRTTGPVVTQYEVTPGPGVKVGRIAALADDLALAMRAQSIRIVAPIPGKGAVGVEIPNPTAELVTVRELIESDAWGTDRTTLPIVLGRDLHGQAIIADLAKMPHLLIAGATGSGKSVCINTIITSLVYRYTPRQLRLLMIDPKMVELSMYNVLPHLRHPVVTNNHKAATALKWAVHEMDRRYRLLHANNARHVADFNKKVESGRPVVFPAGEGHEYAPERADAASPDPAQTELVPSEPRPYTEGPLPYIVVIVDELADLMMTVQSEVETPLAMLAQKARAIGIHLVLATQRPSVNVITGLIKANFPSRIGFRVASKVDSRTILDQNGAETLLGNGDMLFLPPGRSEPIRLQGCFIGTEETERIMRWFEEQQARLEAAEESDILKEMAEIEAREALVGESGDSDGGASVERDPLFRVAAETCIQHQLGSTSLLQRRLSIGYGRAARIMDQLEFAGVLGAANGSKPRDVLLGLDELDALMS